jgi:hypothetical protein
LIAAYLEISSNILGCCAYFHGLSTCNSFSSECPYNVDNAYTD